MKSFVLILLLTLSSCLLAQDPFKRQVAQTVVKQPAEVHHDLEEMPVFPGGPEAMQKYLEGRINRPAAMRGACIGRKLIVGFIVNEDGGLSDVDIIKSINGCPDFDYEVLRVVKAMPAWIPGKLEGRNVRCYYKMPVYID